jgi:hypothetical protein
MAIYEPDRLPAFPPAAHACGEGAGSGARSGSDVHDPTAVLTSEVNARAHGVGSRVVWGMCALRVIDETKAGAQRIMLLALWSRCDFMIVWGGISGL